jgi:hypothetical protein
VNGPTLRWHLLLACLCPCATAVPALAQGNPQSDDRLLAEVRAAWDRRQGAVKTVRVVWTFQNFVPKGALDIQIPLPTRPKGPHAGQPRPPADTTREGRAVLLMDGVKARLKLDDFVWTESEFEFVKRELDSTFDGTKSSKYSRLSGGTSAVGTVHKAAWNTDCDVNTWPICMAFRGAHPNIMDGRDIGKYGIARQTTLDGRRVIELTRERDETQGEGKLWVDPNQDYAAVRYDQYDRKGMLIYRIVMRNAKTDSGIWAPSAWTTTVYWSQKLVRNVQTVVREAAINVPTAEHDFIMVFAPRTHVVDYTGERSHEYIVREGKPPREILPSERGSDWVDLERTEPGDLARGGRARFLSRNRTPLLVVAISLATGVLLVLLARRVLRSTSHRTGHSPQSPEGA